MLIFHQITKLFAGKCARNQTLDMKCIQIALKYCTLTLISSLEQKRSNIQCKSSMLRSTCISLVIFGALGLIEMYNNVHIFTRAPT